MIVREGREQELVRKFFKHAPSGFFVEVGANRPRQESQTWHLEQLGWTGVLIEPQPDLAEDLRRAPIGQGGCRRLLVAARMPAG